MRSSDRSGCGTRAAVCNLDRPTQWQRPGQLWAFLSERTCTQMGSAQRPSGRSDVLDGEARGQTLLQLVSLLEVLDAQRVQVLGAAHLELHNILRLLDLDSCAGTERQRLSAWTAALGGAAAV